jgi:hypothetical protein
MLALALHGLIPNLNRINHLHDRKDWELRASICLSRGSSLETRSNRTERMVCWIPCRLRINHNRKFKILADGLSRITAQRTAQAMQVSDANPMVGIEGRASLLSNLALALKSSPEFFGEDARPGNLIGTSIGLPLSPPTMN